MQTRAKQRGCRQNRREALNARRDDRGYTLQTIIVMSILIAAAVGASVVLLRAVSSNTDARSFTDTAGSNVPSRPHNFVVEKTLASVGTPERNVPSATVRWSPPLYTGFTRFEEQPGEGEKPVDASSASLLYRAEYGCADPADSTEISELAHITLNNIPDDTTNDPMDVLATAEIDESKRDIDGPQTHFGVSTELSLPERILEELFTVAMPPETVYCILRATAYTCPNAPTQDCANPGDNESRTGADDVLTGSEIYSLESELIRFELSMAPTEILNPEYVVPTEGMTATNNRIDLVWDTPEYTGSLATHLYEIKWAQREEGETETDFDASGFDNPDVDYADTICTVANGHSLDLTLNADTNDSTNELIVDIRITPYAYKTTPMPVDIAVPPNFTCPSSDDLIAGEPTDWHGIELVVNGSVPDDDLPTLTITVPPSSESIPIDNTEKRTYLQNRFVNLQAGITLEVPKTTSYNLENYELRWSRADGTGISNSRVITDLGTPTDFIPSPPPTPPLPHERYSSSVILNLENNRAYDFTLTANFNNGETRTTSNCAVISHSKRTPAPALDVIPAIESLRVRITPLNQANLCNFPIVATPSSPSTQHYKVRVYNSASVCASPGNYPDKQCTNDSYNQCITTGTAAKEIIIPELTAATTYEVEVIAGHNCNTSLRTIDFTIPNSNPNNYGYPSAPVTKRAIPNPDISNPPPLTQIRVTHDGTNWNISWESPKYSNLIGYIITAQHRATFDPNEDIIVIAFPFVYPSIEDCSNQDTSLTCSVSIPDDENPIPAAPDTYTSFNITIRIVTSAGFSTSSNRFDQCMLNTARTGMSAETGGGCQINVI